MERNYDGSASVDPWDQKLSVLVILFLLCTAGDVGAADLRLKDFPVCPAVSSTTSIFVDRGIGASSSERATPAAVCQAGATTTPAAGVVPKADSTGRLPVGFLGAGTANSSTFLRGDQTWATPATSGTVTSVSLSLPSWLSVSGSPVTTSGTLAVTAATGQTAGRVVGTCGAGTSVSLCALVAGDLPTVTAAKGGTGIDTSGSTGVPRVTGGTWTANAGVSHLAASTSSALASVLSDETGSGPAVFGASPTLTTVIVNQAANGDAVTTSTRATDTAPTGSFQLFKSAAGSTLWQVDITGSLAAGTVPAALVTGLASGTYTPTLTNVANVGTITSFAAQYIRVGNVITVSGKFDLAATTANIITKVGISLPVASNIAFPYQSAGTSAADGGTTVRAGRISGDATNHRAELQYYPEGTTSIGVYWTFTYSVI